MEATKTDLPFKVSSNAIVVVKDMPVIECTRCPEYLIPDDSMQHVDKILANRTPDAELKVVRFAA